MSGVRKRIRHCGRNARHVSVLTDRAEVVGVDRTKLLHVPPFPHLLALS